MGFDVTTGELPLVQRRWGNRAPLQILAELIATDGEILAVWVRDASVSGAFVETGYELPLLSRVSLCPAGRAGQWLKAVVVREDDGGYGIEWLSPGLLAVSALLSMGREMDQGMPSAAALASNVSWQLLERLHR
jgi:hypothetical protein